MTNGDPVEGPGDPTPGPGGGGEPPAPTPPAGGGAAEGATGSETTTTGTSGAAQTIADGAVSVVMFLGPAITSIGLLTVTDALGRVQRAYPLGIALAFGILLFAGFLMMIRRSEPAGGGGAAGETKTAESQGQSTGTPSTSALAATDPPAGPDAGGALKRFWRWLSSRGTTTGLAYLLVVVGTTYALGLTVLTASYSPRPQITADLTDDRKELAASIDAEFLAPDQRIAIQIQALTTRRQVQTSQAGEIVDDAETIYSGYVGPKADGKVTHAVTLPNPAPEAKAVSVRAFTGDRVAPCVLGTRPSGDNVSKEDYGSGTACVTTLVTPPEEQLAGAQPTPAPDSETAAEATEAGSDDVP